MTILVTGNNSGFGKFLFEELDDTVGFNRQTDFLEIKKQDYDTIIHCAFNSNRNIVSSKLYEYYQDTIGLTQKLLTLKHKKFIFISTVGVYPRIDNKAWSTKDEIIIDTVSSMDGKMKLMCEKIVENNCNNHLIIRASALLGKYMRKNNYLKIIEDKNPVISLSSESTFNFIKYADILKFIKKAINNDSQGTINFVSDTTVKLQEVAKTHNKKVVFGEFIHHFPNLKR